MKTSPCVVVPAHSNILRNHEQIAFRCVLNCLKRHPIFLLVPEGIDLDPFFNIGSGFTPVFVDPKWLNSISSYNHLKCSSRFYELFKNFSHILTYELDCYVFRDELLSWCQQPFDYIGAPWTGDWANGLAGKVGNSGFSLRNVHACLNICKKREMFWPIFSMRPYHLRNLIMMFPSLKKFRSILIADCEAEDHFWSICVPDTFPSFRIAPYEVARRFSFEMTPSRLYSENDFELPFGCHAWHRNEVAFWSEFIPMQGFFV